MTQTSVEAWDHGAEHAVLGDLARNPKVWNEIDDVLAPTDFFESAHRVIYSGLAAMVADGLSPDPVTIIDYFSERGWVGDCGGLGELVRLWDDVSTGNTVHYAKIVRKWAIRRRLRDLFLTSCHTVEKEMTVSNHEIIDRVQAALVEIETKRRPDTITLAVAAQEELARIRLERMQGKTFGLPTGFGLLDCDLAGLQPGQLILVGARPSVGKSSLGLQVALNVALLDKQVTLFSYEMSRQEVSRRALSMRSGVSRGRIASGHLDDPRWQEETRGYWAAVEQAATDFERAGLTIVDGGENTIGAVKGRCRALQISHGLDLVVIDYLQLLASGSRTTNRTEEVSAISRGLKLMAVNLGVPVLVMSQLNREPERRDIGAVRTGEHVKGEPKLADLRESGSQEADANAVILLDRKPEGADEEIRPAAMILAKNRTGPTARYRMRFDPPTTTFTEVERVHS